MITLIKFINRAYRYRFRSDANEIKYIMSNLKEGDVTVDIGAHKGGYLYWMQKKVGKTGRVFGFEPQVKLYRYLKKIIQLRNYTNVIIENKGISSHEGAVNFFIPETKKGSSPGARIGLLNNGTHYHKTQITNTTLDSYFFAHNICPSLIKIDVEGHEKQLLLGGIKLLKKVKPKILMECENRHLSEGTIFDVFDVLLKMGYHGYYFKNKTLTTISSFNIATDQRFLKRHFWQANRYINNFIFEPPKTD